MNIEGMLKYQSLDRELNQLNEKFRTSDATVQYNRYMKLYKQTIEDGKRMSGVAGEHFVNLDRLTKQYEKLLADVEEYNTGINEITDLKQADYYEKQLIKLYTAIESVEKELDNLRKELVKLDADAKAFFANANGYFVNVKKATPEMEKVKRAGKDDRARACREIQEGKGDREVPAARSVRRGYLLLYGLRTRAFQGHCGKTASGRRSGILPQLQQTRIQTVI